MIYLFLFLSVSSLSLSILLFLLYILSPDNLGQTVSVTICPPSSIHPSTHSTWEHDTHCFCQSHTDQFGIVTVSVNHTPASTYLPVHLSLSQYMYSYLHSKLKSCWQFLATFWSSTTNTHIICIACNLINEHCLFVKVIFVQVVKVTTPTSAMSNHGCRDTTDSLQNTFHTVDCLCSNIWSCQKSITITSSQHLHVL